MFGISVYLTYFCNTCKGVAASLLQQCKNAASYNMLYHMNPLKPLKNKLGAVVKKPLFRYASNINPNGIHSAQNVVIETK